MDCETYKKILVACCCMDDCDDCQRECPFYENGNISCNGRAVRMTDDERLVLLTAGFNRASQPYKVAMIDAGFPVSATGMEVLE